MCRIKVDRYIRSNQGACFANLSSDNFVDNNSDSYTNSNNNSDSDNNSNSISDSNNISNTDSNYRSIWYIEANKIYGLAMMQILLIKHLSSLRPF